MLWVLSMLGKMFQRAGCEKKQTWAWMGGIWKNGAWISTHLISAFFGGQFLVTKLQISQKMACHLEKIFLKSKQKHSLWVCSSSSHPKKSTLVCPHRGEHGKNSQLHILQSLRSHKWEPIAMGATRPLLPYIWHSVGGFLPSKQSQTWFFWFYVKVSIF